MRVAFLMGLFPKDNRNEIIKNSRGPIQFAADALEWGYVKGISEQNIKCELFNAPFIGSYPKRYENRSIHRIQMKKSRNG